jgi:hypothetical protein
MLLPLHPNLDKEFNGEKTKRRREIKVKKDAMCCADAAGSSSLLEAMRSTDTHGFDAHLGVVTLDLCDIVRADKAGILAQLMQ